MADIPSTPSDGNVATWVVPEIANTTAPTVEEIEAGVDVSCYLTPDGFALTVEQETITDERLCSTETFGQPGRKSYTLELQGIDNTNSENEAEFNELVDVLVEGTDMFMVRRRGVPFDDPFEDGQKVTVIPFKPGVKQDVPPEANTVIRSSWTCFVTGTVQVEVPIGGAGS